MIERPGRHFKYSEWIISNQYPALADKIKLSDCDRIKIFYIAQILETVREKCGGIPIRITSGKRSSELNKAIGGAKNSDHLFTDEKCATDFILARDGYLLWYVFQILHYSRYAIGQVIIYLYGQNIWWPRFIHLSLPSRKHTGEFLVTVDGEYYTEKTVLEDYPRLEKLI